MEIHSMKKFRFCRLLVGSFCTLGLVLCLPWHFQPSSRVSAAQSGGGTTLRVDVELVTVEVTVLDKKGSPVRNLKKESFRLYEDGKNALIIQADA